MSLTRPNKKRRVLFLSNGHAEDLIAATIIKKLLGQCPYLSIRALPLVGEGRAYDKVDIKIIGPRKLMPSSGFAGFSLLWLVKDIASGWLRIFKRQIDTLRAERTISNVVVCVGDVFLVLLSALFVKKPIIFLPTAKSSYTRKFKEHYRIEKLLMRRLCKLVLPRDKLTTSSLKNFGIKARYIGNVMMDCLEMSGENFGIKPGEYVVGILPGSKKEAYHNLPVILDAVTVINKRFFFSKSSLSKKVDFLLALAPSLSLDKLSMAASQGDSWTLKDSTSAEKKRGIIAHLISSEGSQIKIIQGKFGDVLYSSEVIIGLSGMGNEQAVGLGKPVVSFPGKGPQITRKFLHIQRLLLGGAVSIVETRGEAVAKEVYSVLIHPEKKKKALKAGKERMGGFGAALRAAKLIKKEIEKI